ncbi:hypothetical protein LMTR13_30315 [Bradyrhizobium icense]|uniref:Uncharacterized protein n=2 Tax=Bradyrhizobium icense TaxID=1274631 RepID=A0A1B1UM19_9BRAD|nr:hypothetical protein LMTR13_30315 [Bradyrhizobium icense]
MTAMEELVPADKDSILPYITLRPWLAARHIEPVIAKVEAAVGHRPVIIDLTNERFDQGERRRAVHDVLDELRDPTNGYRNFYDFIGEHENFVPSLQLNAPAEIDAQVPIVAALGRGVAVRLTEPMFRFSTSIAQRLVHIEDHSTIHFIVDFERQTAELLARAAGAIGIVEGIRRILPDSFVSVSASTFPANFVNITQQAIFERQFYDEVVRHIRHRNVIYSDRASVRVERQSGGSGAPAPRIDNALPTDWHFFRVGDDDVDRDAAYQMAALRAVRSPGWANLGVWGTSEIIKTANGDGAIISAQRSTAVRINIHLHQQANFGKPPALPDSETDWSD